MHCTLLSETLVWETTIYIAHREMDRRERAPVAKIPCHESKKINCLSIGFLSIDLWRVAGHLQILFTDTWWTCVRCEKNLMEPQFWILSTPATMFGHGKYGNTNHIPPSMDFHVWPSLAWNAFSPTEQNPSFRNHHIRWSLGNGQAGESPPS